MSAALNFTRELRESLESAHQKPEPTRRFASIRVIRGQSKSCHALTAHVNRMRLRKSKPIRQLAIIFAIEHSDVRKLSKFERTDSIAAV